MKRVKQNRAQAFEISCGCKPQLLRSSFCVRSTHQLIQANRHRLRDVHRAVLFARRNAQQPVAVAEVFVREATLLRSEQQSDTPTLRTQLPPDQKRGSRQGSQWMLQFSMLQRRRSDHQGAVCDRLSNALVFLSMVEQPGRADRRASLAKC